MVHNGILMETIRISVMVSIGLLLFFVVFLQGTLGNHREIIAMCLNHSSHPYKRMCVKSDKILSECISNHNAII